MGRFYLVVDSKKESKIINLDIIKYSDGYIRLKSDNISKNISKKIYKKLLDNGLYMLKKDNRTLNTYLALHRLIACLYGDISNLTIHHIDKDKTNNNIENLVPMSQEMNTWLDSLNYNKMLEIGKKEHKEWINRIRKKNDNLANNPYIQFEILVKALNKPVKEIYLHFKKKIKNIQTIRNIINYFYHVEEFVQWLKCSYINVFEDLNKNIGIII